jgi:hypothetical protein
MNKAELIKNVSDTIKGIAEECKMISKAAITAHGINDKVGSDTLTDSNLYDDLAVTEDAENGVITILVNDYIDYIQGGREPNKPFPWKIAVEVLADWCQRKLGKSDNTTIYFVWKSIVENGIKPRPIFDIPDNLWTSPNNANDLVMEDLTDEYWDDWADEIFEAATIILDDYFND